MQSIETPQALTLLQYNRLIAESLRNRALNGVWIIAELSDVNVRNHCYLELVEKDERGVTVAKIRGIIWANAFYSLNAKFELATQQRIQSGLKVMVKVSINYHEQYGMSVIITDINPEFTIGDMARKRTEILRRLEKEGIINDNKNLPVPVAPQRIAIISSPEAAGYGDFMNQLHNNPSGIIFYTTLFPATMQGVETSRSIIAALDIIAQNSHLFDCVLITRGGGSTTDLNWFDDYELAANVAQFPLPVITAIGHERDNTVLDYISCIRVKTPTAAAEWLVNEASQTLSLIQNIALRISDSVRRIVSESKEQLTTMAMQIPTFAQNIVNKNNVKLEKLAISIPSEIHNIIVTKSTQLTNIHTTLRNSALQLIKVENMRLSHMAATVDAYSPAKTLRRGYSITRTAEGAVVTDASTISPGTTITTTVASGSFKSKTI